jgi:hypothetical protein
MGDMKSELKGKANDMENKAHELKGKIKGHMDQKRTDQKSG